MSRAANLKREGKENAIRRRRREREEAFDRMLDDVADGEAEEKTVDDSRDLRKKLDEIKPQPSNKELAEQISANADQIGQLAKSINDFVGTASKEIERHDVVLGQHGLRLSALEKAVGVLDPQPEPTAKPEPTVKPAAKSEPATKTGTVKVTKVWDNYYDYLYFPVDKYTGKIRWDLPFRSAVDAADCNVSCSWKRRLFLFNPEGQVLREATPEEASRFSCA